MYGIMLSHGERQKQFTAQDELELLELLPALESAMRRCKQSEGQQASSAALEVALESTRQPVVVFDARGGLVWASKRVASLLGRDKGGRPAIPSGLLEAVMKVSALIAGERASTIPRTTIRLPGASGEPAVVELRVGRTDTGAPMIVATFDTTGRASAADLAAEFALTSTQGSVLASLVEGLSARAIAERHAISLATVRSHIGQILSKLGVESRLQAALLAARVLPASLSDETTGDDRARSRR